MAFWNQTLQKPEQLSLKLKHITDINIWKKLCSPCKQSKYDSALQQVHYSFVYVLLCIWRQHGGSWFVVFPGGPVKPKDRVIFCSTVSRNWAALLGNAACSQFDGPHVSNAS